MPGEISIDETGLLASDLFAFKSGLKSSTGSLSMLTTRIIPEWQPTNMYLPNEAMQVTGLWYLFFWSESNFYNFKR